MAEIFNWIAEERGWLFSGLGIVVFVGLWRLVSRMWRKVRQGGISTAQIEPPSTEGWKGVEVQGRYFAWDGPTLHSLDDRPAIPAPDIVIEAIRGLGGTPSFGRQDKLRDHLAQGSMQVYETDRVSWRRELLHAPDGSQVLLVREPMR